MAVSTIHKLDKIVFPAFTINEITNLRMSAELQTLLQFPAGHIAPLKISAQSQRSLLSFTTPEIDLVCANVPVVGASVTSDSTFYMALGTATGKTARANLSHKDFTIAECFMYWTRINLPHNDQGTVDVVVVPVYDGSNEPIVPATSQALVTTQSAGDNFGAGPVTLNAASLAAPTNIEIASNMQLLQLGGASEQWDTFVGCQQVAPTVTIQTPTAVGFDTYGLDGTALSGAAGALTCYARKFRVANGTAEHVKFTATDGLIYPVDTSGGGTPNVTDTIRVELISADDSTNPIVLADGQAIT